MQTSFSPTSNSISNSPAAASLKWLSSSANATMNGEASSISPSSVAHRSFLDKNSSVSFEDAYLIHMGSGPSPEPSMNNNTGTNMYGSSLIQFDDEDDGKIVQESEEDVIRLEEDDDNESITQKDVYSPDGDNEVGYPSESIFGEIRTRKKNSDDESNASW